MKFLIRKLFNYFGFDVLRHQNTPGKYIWLEKYNIKTVIDVGANKGQFVLDFSSKVKDINYISFEPIAKVCDELRLNTRHLKIHIHNFALGLKEEVVEINANNYSPSSSILDISDLHRKNYKNAVNTTKQEIIIKRLDDSINPLTLETNIMIKMDVQGFEENVILGGSNILKKCKVALIETSYFEMFKGEALFDEIHNRMKDLGFRYYGNVYQVFDKHDGSILYSDSLFINESI